MTEPVGVGMSEPTAGVETEMAAHAWSEDLEPDVSPRAPWRLAWIQAAAMVVAGVTLAFAIGTVGWATIQMQRNEAPVPVSNSPTPAGSPMPLWSMPSWSIQPTTIPAIDPGPDAHDHAFLQALSNAQITIDSASEAVFGARWVCGEFHDGYSRSDIVEAVKGRNPTLTHVGAIDFVNAAVNFYCPQ